MDWIKGGFRYGEASGPGHVQIRLLHLCMLCVTWCSDRGVLQPGLELGAGAAVGSQPSTPGVVEAGASSDK